MTYNSRHQGAMATLLVLILSSCGLAAPQDPGKTAAPAEATRYDYTKSPAFPDVFAAYEPRFVPEARLANSQLLQDLTMEGKLKLSLEDAVALAVENNLDIAVARYNLPIAETDLLRAKGGGATRGVAGAYQSNTLFSAEIGASVGGGRGAGGTNAGGLTGGGIPSVGSSGCCDPTLNVFYGWDHAVTPLDYTIATGVSVENTQSAYLSASYSQGFVTGTSFFMGVNGYREASNATTEIYDPFIASGGYVGVSQNLLNGFGNRANAKFIRIAQNDLKYSRSVFRQKVIDIVSKVMSTYFDLIADRDSLRVAREGLAYDQDLLKDQQTLAQIGNVAEFDMLRTREEVAARQQELEAAEATLAQDSLTLKAEVSKTFTGELATVEIDPTDSLPEPHPDDIPPLEAALKEAAQNRPEIEQANVNLKNQQITIQAVRNSLLPSLNTYAVLTPSGLGGSFDPAFTGLLQDRYTNYAYGVRLSIPIRNRVAQADAARALLEQKQLQMQLEQAQNQAVWDVSKAVSAVQQAAGQVTATRGLVDLSTQVLAMERKKFSLAAASVEEVIGAQRDLSTAQNNAVKAQSVYSKALIQFEQATGTLLERNSISLSDAVDGDVSRATNIPGRAAPASDCVSPCP